MEDLITGVGMGGVGGLDAGGACTGSLGAGSVDSSGRTHPILVYMYMELLLGFSLQVEESPNETVDLLTEKKSVMRKCVQAAGSSTEESRLSNQSRSHQVAQLAG